MVENVEIAWLAGIIDGEGCIYGHWQNRRNASGGNVCIEIRVQSTSMAMISKVAEICQKLGVFCVFEDSRWLKKSTKPAHRVSIRRIDAVIKFLRIVRPYLVVKGAEADVALSWYEKWGDQRGRNKSRATPDQKTMLFNTLRNLKRTA